MNMCGGAGVIDLQAFVTLAVDGGELSAPRSVCITLNTHSSGTWLGSQACPVMVTGTKISVLASNRTPVVQTLASHPLY
jgi:hypothetical protein